MIETQRVNSTKRRKDDRHLNPQKKYWESDLNCIPNETRTIFNEYLLSLKVEKKAEATITKYRILLEKFLSEWNVLDELTSDDVLGWLNQYSENKSPRTIKLMLSSLSSFFNFCLEEEYMEKKVLKSRWRPKIPDSLPQFLNGQEYARVKLVMERLNVRDRALMLFLFSSGCRRFEVSYLKLETVDMAKRTARVLGKGNKVRYVHFSEECAFALQEYLETRSIEENDYLFKNKFGNRLGPQGIYKVAIDLGKKAGLPQSLYPHCCRHTFATNMLAKGAELEFIADELGHEDLNTTRVYARIPGEELMNAYQNKMG